MYPRMSNPRMYNPNTIMSFILFPSNGMGIGLDIL